MVNRNTRGIIFDLDGTLVNSPLNYERIRRELGIPKNESILEFLNSFPRKIREEKYHLLEKIELEAAYSSAPYPGAIEWVNHCKKQGIYTALFTRNCRPVVDYTLSKFNFIFDHTISRNEGRPKPDPENVFSLLNKWNLTPEQLLFIGDSFHDENCAKNAGVPFVKVQPLHTRWDATPLYAIHAQ